MVDTPPPNLTVVLADLQHNLAIMQQRADQADTSKATLPPVVDQAWLNHLEEEWNATQADPLDGLSLLMLYYQPKPIDPKEEDYVWDSEQDAAQLAWNQNFNMEQVGTDNDIDEKYLSYYTEGEIIPNARR
ncbi:hypothetical protein RHMOL_Rhmol01G0224600 [Rhododendron molle]|uniref:Uncharacterized protein n=1 Tax=Rhododendron molle TaxID=49168 RepID=A0ACC0Q7P8_RHOML|nr:hypothetical protein RHMOL_Rhmol01G0224600 [Rhododendron molle]